MPGQRAVTLATWSFPVTRQPGYGSALACGDDAQPPSTRINGSAVSKPRSLARGLQVEHALSLRRRMRQLRARLISHPPIGPAYARDQPRPAASMPPKQDLLLWRPARRPEALASGIGHLCRPQVKRRRSLEAPAERKAGAGGIGRRSATYMLHAPLRSAIRARPYRRVEPLCAVANAQC